MNIIGRNITESVAETQSNTNIVGICVVFAHGFLYLVHCGSLGMGKNTRRASYDLTWVCISHNIVAANSVYFVFFRSTVVLFEAFALVGIFYVLVLVVLLMLRHLNHAGN